MASTPCKSYSSKTTISADRRPIRFAFCLNERRMTTRAYSKHAPIPIDGSDPQIRAAAVGQLLRTSFAALIDAFPSHAKTVSEMSRWLEVMRPNCQRIVLGLRAGADPMELLQRFPGTRALNQFVSAAAARGIDAGIVRHAEQAVAEYASLIGEFGGTQRRLTARLGRAAPSSSNEPVDPSSAEALRQQGYAFASRTAGYRCAARTEISIVRVMPSDPTRLEIVVASGLIGAVRRAEGMPICRMHRTVGRTPDISATSTLEGTRSTGIAPRSLIPGFSTSDVPSVGRALTDGWTLEVFNEDGNDQPIDLVVGNHHAPATEHPATTAAHIYNCGVLVAVPAERLVIDVYLERALAQSSIVSAAVFFTGMIGGLGPNRPETRWYDRVPGEPPIQHLGVGLRKPNCLAYPRQGELTSHLFEASGWNPDRFVGFRCECAYPIWGTEYVMTFDFDSDRSGVP